MVNKIVALFPGQGAQHVGMGKDLLENFKIAREIFEEASDACKLNLKKLCLDGPESDLTLTENTQPCLLTTSVAAFRVAQAETGFKPDAAAGHSLGEYSALVAAGALKLSDAARWVRARGRAMQEAVPPGQGAMAAVLGLEDSLVEQACKVALSKASERRSKGEIEDITVSCAVEPVNYNAPGQLVTAGSKDGVDALLEVLKSDERFKGAKAIPLAVSAPFHSTLMKPAREKMAELFKKENAQALPLTFPYVPNRTARLCTESQVIFDLLVDQVDHAVLWSPSIKNLIVAGFTKGVEFGPGKVLQGLCKRIKSDEGTALSVSSCGDSKGITEMSGALK